MQGLFVALHVSGLDAAPARSEGGQQAPRGLDGGLASVQRLRFNVTLKHVHYSAHGRAGRRIVLNTQKRAVNSSHCVFLVEVFNLLDVQPLVEKLHGTPFAH